MFYCHRIYILTKSKYAVAVIAMVCLKALATKLSYSCIMDIIAALDFTDRFSVRSGNTNEGSRTSYQFTGYKDISDYNWCAFSLASPKQIHSEFNTTNRSGVGGIVGCDSIIAIIMVYYVRQQQKIASRIQALRV